MASGVNGAFPDVVVTEEDLIASGDKVVERSSAAATHKGPMLGTPATNKRIKWSEIHIYRLSNGKIAEHWPEISMMELPCNRSARSRNLGDRHECRGTSTLSPIGGAARETLTLRREKAVPLRFSPGAAFVWLRVGRKCRLTS